MTIVNKSTLAIVLILAGIISLTFGSVFIVQGFAKANLITEAMRIERAAYGSADGEIEGVIDTCYEAQVMAGVLREHRMERYGVYTELERDDPGRATILSAMTMENALNMAVLSYGVTDMAKANGGFMAVIGITLILGGVYVSRTRKTSAE